VPVVFVLQISLQGHRSDVGPFSLLWPFWWPV